MKAIAVCLILAVSIGAQDQPSVGFSKPTDTEDFEFYYDLAMVIAGFLVCLPIAVFFWRRAMTNTPVSLKIDALESKDSVKADGDIVSDSTAKVSDNRLQ